MKHFNLAVGILLSILVSQADAATNTNADNTAKNKRDAQAHEKTAMDQSNKPSDVEVTRVIRQSIMDDKTLSVNAQNVKIIVAQNSVTLKGPVKSAQEISTIESKARAAAPNMKIVNQLEVTQK